MGKYLNIDVDERPKMLMIGAFIVSLVPVIGIWWFGSFTTRNLGTSIIAGLFSLIMLFIHTLILIVILSWDNLVG